MSECALKTRRRPRAPPARAVRPLRAPAVPLRQLLAPGPAARVQPRLMVGAVSDPAEREADQVAERVLSGALREAPAPAGGAADPPAAPRRSVEDQPSLDEVEQEPPLPETMQDVDLPAAEDVVTDAIDEGDLGELSSGEPADLPEAPPAPPEPPPTPEEQLLLSRAPAPTVGPEGGAAPAAIDAAIRAPGPGRPLPAPLRREMDRGFGTDFADVRLHDRPEDRAAAAAIGARAFAYGADIWLGPGERAEDRRLMAHELAHVVQQTGRARARIMDPGGATAPARPRRGIARLISEAVLAKVESYARYV
ncbi:MAG: DUF4157 domain-containing protein, partial [Paracoccaceae bacterium]|nr:DUF4157 domain-containing protein [Paracoccaceae bacterium]